MGGIRFWDLDTEFIVGFVLFKGFVDSKKYKIPPDFFATIHNQKKLFGKQWKLQITKVPIRT